MTTKPAYNIQSQIDYGGLSFNPDEPEPLPDAMLQYPIFKDIFSILDAHLTSIYPPDEVFQSSNTFICYDRNNLNARVAPDFYFAAGVDAQAIRNRRLYLPWEAGKPPDFVLEVGSERTAQQDVTSKRLLYARIGISEYWRFDPTGGEFYGRPLAGDRRVDGAYQPIELTTEPDGVLKGYSPALRLSLCWRDEMLVFYHRESGVYLRTLKQEQAAREAAEARIRQLEEELRRQQ